MCRYHIYKEIWEVSYGEMFDCAKEICCFKNSSIDCNVGHLSQKQYHIRRNFQMKLFSNISKITSHFRKHNFEIFWQFQNGNVEIPQVLAPFVNYARNTS